MKYIIGMDGGGTKTRCIIADLDGKALYECTGGPSNFLIIGMKAASKNIFSLIKQCVNKLKIDYNNIYIVLIGTAGAGRKNDALKFEKGFKDYLKEKNIVLKKLIVESDAKVALEAAFPGRPGCILIAGTGSIIMGKDSAGNFYRAGGFGRYLGDEGSGYILGKKALIAAAKEYDGRGTATIITKMLKERFKINSPEDLISEIYHKEFDIASAAPLLLEAAELKDPAALKIIDEEIEELLAHLKAMLAKINTPELNTALAGSLLDKDNIYSRRLKEKLRELPSIKLTIPEKAPVEGAVLLAKAYLSQKIDQNKQNVKKG
ncbi:MAG TPA: BadF/BadG/BcrA/BcrD ATPase family protein [Ignavibacteriaceae bacterium]|nr:BadF/BadG/BcrA/BcrD ATPase family protein [Ignavibacteriaceae bacterium]